MKATILVIFAIFATAAAQQTLNEFINDNNVLNYALTLENLEANFYQQGLNIFTSDDNFTAAGYPAGTRALINFIAGQESSHATTLAAVVSGRGWSAAKACQYNFGASFASPQSFLATLVTIEGYGTGAYAGAAQALTDATLLTIAAGIATIEARHTSALALLLNNGNGSFPSSFNPAYTEGTVFDTVKGYFVAGSCPSNPVQVPYTGTTVNTISTDPTTYTWQNVSTLRGSTNTANNDGAFYYTNNTILQSDLSIFQYALYLENLEATFYAQFNLSYTPSAILADPNFATYFNSTTAGIASNNIGAIAAQESAHVAYLRQAISAGGGSPANACASYNWTAIGLPNSPNSTSPTFTQFLTAAATLEDAGVSAYVGAIALITNSDYATVAATVATVEGRHAAYIVSVLKRNPPTTDPAAIPGNGQYGTPADNPVTPAATYNTISAILGSCSNAAPTPAPYLGSATVFNYLGDAVLANALAPYPVNASTGTGSPAASTGNGPSNGTPVVSSTTGTSAKGTNTAAGVALSFALIAAAAILL